MPQTSEWDNERDLKTIRKVFDAWACAVIAKDRPTIETFHDDGFTVTLPDGTLLDKDGHIALEIGAGMFRMELRSLKVRRCGDIILVWARRYMEGTQAPAVEGSSLGDGWVASQTMRQGFEQADFSVWREDRSGALKCLAFELTMLI